MSEKWRSIADPYWHQLLNIDPEISAENTNFIDKMIDKIWSCEQPTATEIKLIIRESVDILKNEPNILTLDPPLTVCGDIHGQFYDMIQIFRFAGIPPVTSYLFLGDYVDRGDYSIQVIILLCLFKIKYPNNFYMIRGNHESTNISRIYGFYNEIISRYDDDSLFEEFEPLFQALPIAAIIGRKIFCVHGGISPNLQTIDDISKLNRFIEPERVGDLADLLWSDPTDDCSRFFASERNSGQKFGKVATYEFLTNNNLTKIIRAHQLMNNGYKWHHSESVLTIFSAPNYEKKEKNKAAIACINEDLCINIIGFSASPPLSSTVTYDQYIF